MRILRRYLAVEVALATAVVLAALVLLFAFFDVMQEMRDVGRGTYGMPQITAHVLLLVPNHVYEIFPIAALIGTLFAVGGLVASSEYTVMRTAGVSLVRLNAALAGLGVAFAAIVFLVGEFVGPPAAQWAQRLRSQSISGIVAQEFRSGLWLKDGRSFVNISEVTVDGELRRVRVYAFDDAMRLSTLTLADRGRYIGSGTWRLAGVSTTAFGQREVSVRNLSEMDWRSVLEPGLLSMLIVQPNRMSAWNLYSYTGFLKTNGQKAARYEVALWAKLVNPITIVVLMILSIPFALFQTRRGGGGARVVTGILLGLAFYTINALSGTLAVLYDLSPAVSAISPTVVFLALAVVLMRWQERR